jgi:hypothetical protein
MELLALFLMWAGFRLWSWSRSRPTGQARLRGLGASITAMVQSSRPAHQSARPPRLPRGPACR